MTTVLHRVLRCPPTAPVLVLFINRADSEKAALVFKEFHHVHFTFHYEFFRSKVFFAEKYGFLRNVSGVAAGLTSNWESHTVHITQIDPMLGFRNACIWCLFAVYQ